MVKLLCQLVEPLNSDFSVLETRYLGIWYKKVSTGTVVWVANRETSVSDSSGVLSINDKGVLSVTNSTKSSWSSNTSRNAAEETVAQLLDSGNFVVKDRNNSDPENFLWQSFDYPCDTFLPGMKIGRNFVTGFERHISSWKSMENPASGLYTISIDLRGLPQALLQRSIWNERKNDWDVFSTSQTDHCSIYADCGPYASCIPEESPPCKCLEGFVHRQASTGDLGPEWSNGCTRRTPVNCSCTAYANLDIREGGRGCLLWFGELIDIIEFGKGGQDLYIRLAISDLNHIQTKGKLKEKEEAGVIAISVIVASGTAILAFSLYVRKRKLRKTGT
ncbi:hypothetical protein V6N12_054547 [Hibiscus sabdariffa]|uniref:Bulb-type lectin domain-containing protein n=1 Tax=Hibiscus sabdariffa TaxID=183260 RepID=A0ABR2D0R7_9ROSI